jgi:hypothetical protein
VHFPGLERLLRRKRLELVGGERTTAANFGEHVIRRHPRKAPHRGRDRRAERQNSFVDRDQVDNISRHSPIGRGRRFVRCQIGRLQHIAKRLILLSGEKMEIGVRDPFELCCLIDTLNQANRKQLTQPTCPSHDTPDAPYLQHL